MVAKFGFIQTFVVIMYKTGFFCSVFASQVYHHITHVRLATHSHDKLNTNDADMEKTLLNLDSQPIVTLLRQWMSSTSVGITAEEKVE